ncbi:MAG: chorismate mutase [bacterium]
MTNARIFSQSLSDLRAQIDTCDDALMGLLKKRMQIVADVAQLKKGQSHAFIRPARETQILRRLLAESGTLPPAFVMAVWRTLMMGALQYEDPFRVGYVGEEGLKLAIQLFGAITPYQGFSGYADLLQAYTTQAIDYMILPLTEATTWLTPLRDVSGSVLFHLPLMATCAETMQALVWGEGVPESSGHDFSWHYLPKGMPPLPNAAMVAETAEGSLWTSEETPEDTQGHFWGYTGLLA